MLDTVQKSQPYQIDAGYDVEIASIATAVPPYSFSQSDALERVSYFIPRCGYLSKVFGNTGIATRYSCVPLSWYRESRGWKDANKVYLECALDLLEDAGRKAIDAAGLTGGDIDAIVTVTSTGLAIPSMDALLINRMELNNDAERLPIFGLGCAGGTSGLARACRMAQSMPGGNVLVLVVELAGINVHVNQRSPALFVSAALFGDGAAALVLRNRLGQDGAPARHLGLERPRMIATGEHLWRDTGHIMGWNVEDDGLDVVLSSELPGFTRDNLRPAIERFLARHRMTLEDMKGFIFHPGGRKVLEAISDALDLDDDALRHSWDVLKNYGNMSAPTVLFILERTIEAGGRGRHLMVSFGPGFTITFAVIDL